MNTPADQNKEKFLRLANDLTIYFPDYLLHTPDGHWNVYFEHKTEPSKGFYLNPDNYSGKFKVSPKIIKQPHYSFSVYNKDNVRLESPTAGFSIDRPAEAIAKGIKTRFFPDFELYYTEWIRCWQVQDDYKNGKENTIRALAEIVGVKAENGHTGEIRENISLYYSPHANLKEYLSDIRVSSMDSIEIKTNYLTREKAIKLLEFIKTL